MSHQYSSRANFDCAMDVQCHLNKLFHSNNSPRTRMSMRIEAELLSVTYVTLFTWRTTDLDLDLELTLVLRLHLMSF